MPYSAPVIPITGIKHPRAIAVNEGNVYVLDSVDQRVYRILAGTTTPVAFSAGFTKATCFTVDLSGNVYIFDAADNEVVEKPYNGGKPYTILSPYGTPAIAMAAINTTNVELVMLSKNSSGKYQVSATSLNGSSPGFLITPGLVSPAGIAVDELGENVYVTDPGSNGVYKISTTSPYTKTLIYTDTNKPCGITVDYSNNLYITDLATNKVVMIPVVGTPLTIASGFNKPVSLSTNIFPFLKSIYIYVILGIRQ